MVIPDCAPGPSLDRRNRAMTGRHSRTPHVAFSSPLR